MRIVDEKIYNFNELAEDIKNKLIADRKNSEYVFYCDYTLYDDMLCNGNELLKRYFDYKAVFVKTYYNLDYSQGSGAMIEFNINIVDLNNKYKIFSDDEVKFLTDKDIVNDIRVKQNGHYYHEYSFIIDYDYYNSWDFEDIKEDYSINESDFDTIEDRFYKLMSTSNIHYTESAFVKDIVSMNKEYTKMGYDLLDNCIDNYSILDMLCENEYYSDGRVYEGV